jgi:hypothetical protein
MTFVGIVATAARGVAERAAAAGAAARPLLPMLRRPAAAAAATATLRAPTTRTLGTCGAHTLEPATAAGCGAGGARVQRLRAGMLAAATAAGTAGGTAAAAGLLLCACEVEQPQPQPPERLLPQPPPQQEQQEQQQTAPAGLPKEKLVAKGDKGSGKQKTQAGVTKPAKGQGKQKESDTSKNTDKKKDKPTATVRIDWEHEMLHRRRVFISGTIDTKLAKHVVGQLLYLEALSDDQPIEIVINSGGGVVTAGLAIYDIVSSPF